MDNVMGKHWKVLLVVLFLFLSAFVKGDDHIVFEQLSTQDGLPNGTINAIFRESSGYMWFCTDDGICRYDGYNFKVYQPKIADDSLLQNIQFFSIVEDSFNNIWIGTSQGLYFYDQNKDRIVHFITLSDIDFKNTPLGVPILCLFYDSFHCLWVGTYNGIVRINIDQQDIRAIKPADFSLFTVSSNDSFKISNNSIISIFEDSQHQIWFTSNSNKLDCYNYQQQKIVQQKIEIPELDKWGYLTKIIKADANNDFWIATMGVGLIYWQREKNIFTQIKSISNDSEIIDIRFVKSLMIDDRNRIWIGTDGNGLVLFDKEKNEIKHFLKNKEDQSKLSGNAIYSMYQDTTGIYWFGTYMMGLNKFVSNKTNFGAIYSLPYSETGLSHNIVTNFCEDQNNQIWISTDGGGLNMFDRKKFQFKHYKHDPLNLASISTNTTVSLFCDCNNSIWIGTYNGGLNRFDQKTQKFEHFWYNSNDSSSISSNLPWGFAEDKWNNLWVSTVDAGLNLLKSGSKSFIRYEDIDSNYFGSDEINNNSITQLFIDENNHLWIGTEYGLDLVDLNHVDFSLSKPVLTFTHYLPSNTINSISHSKISCINEDSLNNLWIGTNGGGLNKLDLKTNIFTSYTVNDGLSHNVVKGILFDEDNNPWISTNNGLSYLNTKTNKFKNYNTSDGLQSNVFYKTSCFKSSDGMFFFGGINGFNAFYPEEIVSKKSELKPVIIDFKLFNQSVSIDEKINDRVIISSPIDKVEDIELFYKENSIAFEFSALDYSNPEKIYYSYKLEGFDENWHITDAKMRIATYTNLPFGKYSFSVKASTNKDDWINTATSIQINIRPPWWKTLVFKIVAIILLITFWIVGFSVRVYSLEKQKFKLKSKVEEKTMELQKSNMMKDKFLSIIAHDLINPFNAILGFSDLLLTNFSSWNDEEKMKSVEAINVSSNNLFELLGNLLQWSRSERGLLEYSPEKIDLDQCIQKNVSIQTITAETKKITIHTEFTNESCLVNSDVQLLNAIIRNLLSNAIKFTSVGGEICIRTERKDSCMKVLVIDNGIGIAKDKIDNIFRIDQHQSTLGTNDEKGTGLGLILVNEFVIKQKGTLTIQSEVNVGSTFSFTIPCWER